MALTCAALILVSLAASAVAGPVNSRYTTSTQCANFCPENTKYGFESGKTYEYNYETAIKTHIPGASSDHSSLHMAAVAKVEVLSRCEMALRLESVTLKDVAPGSEQATSAARSSAFATALEQRPLRFAFVSGNIQSVCPNEQEDTWVLNVKRAVISHLQNTMNDFNTDFRSRETDVTGDCPVTYTTESAGWNGVHSIKKSKNLEACSGRLSADTVLQGTAYRTPSNMQSLPLMKGSHECEQKINRESRLVESTCTENHVFRPFSKGSKGATTDIVTKLTFKQETSGVRTPTACGEAKPITFDHIKAREELISSKTGAERVLRQMCTQTTNGVSATAPSLFGELVHELKKLDVESLVSLHRDLAGSGFCKHAEKYLHDAVPTLGTEASARLIKNLVLSGEVSGAESALWLNSLAFVQEPTAAMLKEVTPLVSASPLNRHAALAVSSLVNNFCRHTDNCGQTAEVRAITAALDAHLANGCQKAARNHHEVIASLKALGNTGHGNTETLNQCIRNADLDMELRVAAVNAFRRMGCDDDRSELVRTFENAELDAELRINAYLALMTCPTTDVLTRVRMMLEREEVNQVGSFVWTHLTNLMETSSPLKQEVRQIVEQEALRKEFDMDKRKFSRNIEKSYFSDLLNSGASVESNVIWSPSSFVPRSASVNLTADLFGHSVNLVEVGGRVEGLNGILDDLFDTNAPASANKDTTAEINRVNKRFGGKTESKDPKGSAYLRVFGNEIAYADFHDLDASSITDKFNYLNWLVELAKEHTFDFSKSFQFIDTTVNVATIAGFPLRIHVEGNGVTDIKMKGKLDLRELAASPRNLVIDGSIAPSAALEIKAEMGVDAFAAQTGLRTVDTLHTSSVAEASMSLNNGQVFMMDVKVPRDKMEIFSAKHSIFVVYRGRPQEMSMPAGKITYNKCLGGTFTTVTGLEVCGNVVLPSSLSVTDGPYVPLSSSGEISLTLNKRDTFNKYHFETRFLRERKSHASHSDIVEIAVVSFNTPGSRVNRELTVDFGLNYSEKKMDLKVITPWTPRTQFSGAFVSTNELKKATATAAFGSTRYAALAEVKTVTNKYNTRYLPKFELQLPTGPKPTVGGTILYRSGRKIDVAMTAENIFSETVNVEGSITGTKEEKKTRYETTLNIKSPIVRGKIDGFVDRTESDGTVYSSRLEVAYKPAGALNNRLTFSGKVRDKNNDKKSDMSGTVAFTSTMWPRYDTDAKFAISHQGRTMSSSIEGTFAGDETRSLKIEQNGLLNWGSSMKKANMAVDVKVPYFSIDHNVNLSHMSKKDTMQSSILLTKAGAEHCLIDVDMKRESAEPLKASADIKVHYPGRQMRYTHTLEEVKNKHFKNILNLQLEEGQAIRLTADYKMLPRHELEAQLTTPYFSPVNFNGHLNPVFRKFEAKASVEHAGNQYAADIDMNLKYNSKHVAAQLIHPQRTILTEAETKTVGKTISGSFETQWDAQRDPNKKFSISGEVTLAKMRPHLSIKAELFPKKYIQVITNGEFTHRGANCNHQGDFTFRSSFAKFEEITASFKNKITPSEVSASAQVSWAANQKIDGSFILNRRNGWNSVDVNAKLTTPFSEAKRILYTLDYALEGTTFRGQTTGQFNRHKVGVNVIGAVESPSLKGSITMTSSFMKKVVFSANHIDTGRKCHSDADLTWGDNEKIALVYNMEHARSGYHLNNNGDLQVKTPFKGYRNSKISWRHSNDDNSVKHHIEAEMFKQKAVYDFDGSLTTTGNARRLNINTYLSAPKVDWRFTVEHQHNTADYKDMRTTGLIQWATGKNIQITNDFTMDSSAMKESFKFISPFEGMETISLEMDNTYSPTVISAKNELKWPTDRASFNGEMRRTGHELDANFQLDTPFMPTQKMSIINTMQGNRGSSRKTYEYAPGKVITLSSSFISGTASKFTIDFTSPFERMSKVHFDTDYSGNWRDFDFESEFFHNYMASQAQMNLRLSTSDINDMKVNFNLKTPTHSLSFLQATYSHKLENNEFKCSTSFQMPSYKATFDHEMNGNLRRFNTKTTAVYGSNEKIELTSRFNSMTNIVGDIALSSPFCDDLAFHFNHEGPVSSMKSRFDASLGRTKKITGTFEFRNTNGLFTTAQLTTPFMGYKVMGFTISHTGQVTDMKTEASLNIERAAITATNTFSMGSGHFSLDTKLTTPFSGHESYALSYETEGPWTNFKCEGQFDYPGGRITNKHNFRLRKNGLNMKMENRTPFNFMRVVILEFEHNGPITDFTNSLNFRLNSNKYEAASKFKYTENTISGTASVNIPTEYSITFQHAGDFTSFSNSLVSKFNNQQMSGRSSYRYNNNNIEGSLLIETPFDNFKKFSIVANHHGPLDNFQCDYTVKLNDERMTISDEFKLEGNSLLAKLEISTPFTALRTFNFNFNHAGPVTSFKNGGFVTINNARYTGNSEFSLNGNTVNGRAAVLIPNEYSIAFEHEGTLTEFSNSITLKASDQVINGNTEFKWDNNMHFSARLTTPFTDPIVLKYKHNGELINFEQEITLTHGRNNYFTMMKFEKTNQAMNFEGQMRTPFEAIRSLVIQANHNGKNWKNFRNNIDVTHNGVKRSSNIDFKWYSNLFRLKATASTPETYSLVLKHKMQNRNLDADLKISTPSHGNIDGSYQFDMTEDAITGSFVLSTPFKYFRSQSIIFEHKMERSGFESKINIMTSLPTFRKFEAILNHDGNLEHFTTSGKVNLDSQKMSFTVRHHGMWQDFTSSASVMVNDQTVSANAEFKMTGNTIISSGQLTTPFTGFEKMTINLNHRGGLKSFSSSLEMAKNRDILSTQVAFEYSPTKISLEGSITTPFTGFEKMTLNFNHEGHPTNFRSSAAVGKNSDVITAEISFEMESSKISTAGSLTTPFIGFERMGYDFSHIGGLKNFNCKLDVSKNDHTWTGEANFRMSGNEITAVLVTKCPHSGERRLTINLNHSGDVTDFTTRASIAYNNKVIATETNFKKNGNKIDSSFSLTTFNNNRLVLNFEHEGVLTNFKTNIAGSLNDDRITGELMFKKSKEKITVSLSVTTPFTGFERMGVAAEGQIKAGSTTGSITINGQRAGVDFSYSMIGEKISSSITVTTPFAGYERFSLAMEGEKTSNGLTGAITVNGRRATVELTYSMTQKKISSSIAITTPIEGFEHMSLAIEGEKMSNGVTGSITVNGRTITVTFTYDKTGNKISSSLTATTPFEGFERMSLALEGEKTSESCTGSITVNGMRVDVAFTFKKIGSKISSSLTVNTPFEAFRRNSLMVEGEKTANGVTGSISVNGLSSNVEFTFRKSGNRITSTANLNIPVTNYERWGISFNHAGEIDDFQTSLELDTPFKKIEFSYNHKGSLNDFECEAAISSEGRRYAGTLKFKFANGALETSMSIDTPERKYENFGINTNYRSLSRGVRSSVNVKTPFDGYKNFDAEFQADGPVSDFRTSGSVNIGSWPVKFSLENRGGLSDFSSNGFVELMNRRFAGSHSFKYGNGNIDATGSFGDYRYELKHSNTQRGFNTKGSIETPNEQYEKASFELNHDGNLNNFATSGKINPFSGEGSFSLTHRGNIDDFATSAELAWNGRSINGDVVFKNDDGNVEGRATLTTPFEGYQRFQGEIKHSKVGRKIKTEVNLETPSRGIRNPSFLVDHRGHWKNFKTQISVVSPFKIIKPITLNLNHRGIPKDFTTTGSVQYGKYMTTATGKYERTPTGFTASGHMTTPIEGAEKFGFDVDHSYDGAALKTKASLEMPHKDYKHFGVEVEHNGNMQKFETSGKVETPFTKPVTFEINHDGVLSNFECRGHVQHDGRRVEGEARYKRAGTHHNGFVRVATPLSYLQNAEATLTHNHQNDQINGNLKGSYNSHRFDTDYNLENQRTKSVGVTMRHPRPMQYSLSAIPAEKKAMATAHWDTTNPEKKVHVEAILKNIVDASQTDREITLTMQCPHDTHKFTFGYRLTDGAFGATAEVKSQSGIFRQEVELSKVIRGREVIYDGLFKTQTPMSNFEMNGNHKVNAGRRYMTEINLVNNNLQFRSDIKTPSNTDFNTAFTISHPSFTKPVQIAVVGKIDTNENVYDGKVDLDYANEKITFTGKIADESNSYKTRVVVESSLKHPQNKLDVAFKSLVLDNKKVFKIDSEFSYLMSATNRKNVLTGAVDFNKNTEELKVNVVTPMKSIDVTGKRTINEASRQHFSVTGTVDKEPMTAEIDIDKTVPSISTSLDYAPGRTLHMFAKYVSTDHFTMEAYRQIPGSKIPEAKFDVEIVGGHLVKSSVFLRPGTVSDLSEVFSIDSGVGRLYSDISSSIAQDLRLKVPGTKRAIEPVISAMESASQGLLVMAQRTEQFISANTFYTRDISRTVAAFFTRLRASLDEAVAQYMEFINNMEQLYSQVAARYDQWRQATVVKYNRFYQTAAAKMTEYRNNFHKMIAQHVTNMQGSLLDLANYIRTRPGVQSFVNAVQAKGVRILERISELADNMAEAAQSFINRPELSTLKQYISMANEKTAWIFEYINLEVQAREWLHSLKTTGLTPLRRTAWMTLKELLHLDDTRINTWAPERGTIAGQVYIPMLMRDLRSMPTLNVRGFVDNIKRHMPDTDWVFWDTLYAYRPSSDIRDWIPPFKSHASFAGNQHFMTFDKRFFEFSGECSYLLARDFIDGTFSVIVNYQRGKNAGVKKSLSIVHGTNTVEILPDSRVEVNGHRTELPVIGEHTAVYRVGNTLRIDNDHGVKITCNLPHDHCTVSVSGWYYGKTAGLLGTYDNEPSDDLTKVNGEKAGNLVDFAQSWNTGSRCRAINHATNNDISPVHPKYDECARLFQAQTSPFRPCFKQRDPAAFMQMCMNGDSCKIASFYVSECGQLEVPIRMPRQCVTCQLPGGTQMSEGQEETISGTSVPKQADVIFVVSHAECNKAAMGKMEIVANQITANMKGLNIDVHFGLVGYGGEGREFEPHSQTMDGHLMNSKTTFLNTISNFRTLNINNENEDALAAIEFAASQYNFRAGASKSIVLMPCAKCNTKKVAYSTIQAALSEQDIKFHMLIHEDFQLSAYSKSPKTSYMYGIDREHVYTAKDARGREVRGDKDLRRHTLAPKDLCVALTHESDGSVFNMRKLTETTSDKQKRFATVLSRVIAKKGTPAECQRCECRSDESGVGVTVCLPCQPVTPYVFEWDYSSLPEPEVPFIKSRSL